MIFKAITFVAALSALSLFASAEEQEFAPVYEQNHCKPRPVNCATGPVVHRACENPCSLAAAPDCGLAVCSCPSNCSTLWFSGCKGSNAGEARDIGAECRDIQKDCRVKCLPLDPEDFPSFKGKVVGACVGYSSFVRPYCIFPGAADSCVLATGLKGNLTLKNGKFECVKEVPALLLPGQYETCPLGYYATCLLVDDNCSLLQ